MTTVLSYVDKYIHYT